jgi:opacity protein-like surface antigen
MGTSGSVKHYRVCTALALLVGLALYQPVAHGESYIAGEFGVTLPSIGKGLTNIETTSTFQEGTTVSDLGLKSSAFYGLKAGHYFRKSPWFGLEAEIFNATSHVKQQTQTFFAPNGSAVASTLQPGAHFRVLTIAPVNLMFRYHKTRLQPYVGIGPGIFFAKLSSSDVPNTQKDTRLGLNAKAGLEYFFTRRVSVFGEYKFNYARFNFPNDANAFPFPYGFNATYKMHLVGFGLSLHF